MIRCLIFLVLLLPNFAQALLDPSISITPTPALTCSDPAKGTVLLYVNGQENEFLQLEEVMDTFDGFLKSSQLNLKPKLDKNSKVELTYVFNPTLGRIGGDDGLALADFMESAALILQTELNISQMNAWVLAYSGLVLGVRMADIKSLVGKEIVIDQRTRDALEIPMLSLLVAEARVSESLKTAIKKQLFELGKKLLLVSHSQGNLFVNKAISELRDTSTAIGTKTYQFNDYLKFLGNAQIATPAGYVEIYQKASYITNRLDIINKVFTGLPANFPGNEEYIPPSQLDPAFSDYDHEYHHGILSSYLYGRGSPHAISLAQRTIQNWVDVAGKLESNCQEEADDYLPDVDYSASLGNIFNPTILDATDRIEALTKLEKADFVKIRWEVGGTSTTSEEATQSVYLSMEKSYPGTAKIYLNNGKTYDIDFEVDLTSYVGGPILVKQLELNDNEAISATAMDHGRNLFLLATNQGRMIAMNPDSGEIVEEKSFLPNVLKMEVSKKGKLMVVYMNDQNKYAYTLRDFKTGDSLADKVLEDGFVSYNDWAFDRKNDIFYYTISSGNYSIDPATGAYQSFDTLVAIGATTGVELARGSYLVNISAGQRGTSLTYPTFVNRDGQLIRMGGSMYWDDMFMPVFDYTFSAAYNPATQQIQMSYYPEFYGTSGLVQMDNRKNLTYAYMHKHGFIGSGRFTAIDSRLRSMVYSREPAAVPFLHNPQIARSGHFMGIQWQCSDVCTTGVYRLMRSDEVAPVLNPELPLAN